jgi:hypothetical protein
MRHRGQRAAQLELHRGGDAGKGAAYRLRLSSDACGGWPDLEGIYDDPLDHARSNRLRNAVATRDTASFAAIPA